MEAGADQLAMRARFPKEALPSFQLELNGVKWHSAMMAGASFTVLTYMVSSTCKMLLTILHLKPFQHQFR